MKSLRFFPVLLFATLALRAADAPKEEAEPAAPTPPPVARGIEYSDAPQVTVDLLAISLPTEKALPLLPELRDPKRIKEAQAKLLALVEKKEAKLIGWPEVTTLSGTRSVSEDITEYKYPVEFGGAGQPPRDAKGEQVKLETGWKIDEAAGVMIETKNIGTTLDAEPVVQSQGNGITIAVEAQSVELAKIKEYYMATNPKGEEVTSPHTIFATAKTTTTIRLISGQRLLLHAGRTLEAEDRMTLFITGAKIEDPD